MWIEIAATVLSGVTIGEKAIVCAGSVVTLNVEPKTIVAGHSALVIKMLSGKSFN